MEVRLTDESKQVLNQLSEALKKLTDAIECRQLDTKEAERVIALLEEALNQIRFTSDTSGGPS